MRKVIVSEFVTLDGVMEAPGGEPGHVHSGWVIEFMGREQLKYKLDETLEAGSLLIGRVTYESFASAWPDRSFGDEIEDAVPDDEMTVFADKMNAMPKHVVSTTLKDPQWNNSSVISGDLSTAVTQLRQQDGGPILVMGSRTLVHSLMALDLVDEFRIMVFPVLVGHGRKLFPETQNKTVLRLVDSQRFATGVVVQTYKRH